MGLNIVKYFFIILAFNLLSYAAQANGKTGAKLGPIEKAGIIYFYEIERTPESYSLYLTATFSKDRFSMWRTKILGRKYNTSLENNVQEIILKSLVLKGSSLVATDSKGRVYKVEITAGSLLEPKKPFIYKASH